MNITRNGKIARLPETIRQQLNRRLQNGELGTELVKWLNSLPEVQSVIHAEFGGNPVREQNLSEWKQGGYLEWQEQQEALEMAGHISANFDALTQAAGGPLTDKMALWLTTRYLVAARKLEGIATGDEPAWNRMTELRKSLVALRRGDHHAQRLQLEREKHEYSLRNDQARALELCLEDAKQYPDVVKHFQVAFKHLKARRAGIIPSPKRGKNPTESD